MAQTEHGIGGIIPRFGAVYIPFRSQHPIGQRNWGALTDPNVTLADALRR